MPRRDGSGPMGAGSMTGRGKGICSGIETKGSAYTIGLKCGNRKGGGLGKMRCTYGLSKRACYRNQSANGSLTGNEEQELLMNQAKQLKNQLDDVKKRLEDLEKNTEE